MMDSETIILRAIIARLEPNVGEIARNNRARRAQLPDGVGHLVQALLMAERALASGNPEEIKLAAIHAPPMERTGNELREAKRLQDEGRRKQEKETGERLNRQKGGTERGKRQHAEAEARWAPYVKKFHELMDAGKDETQARSIVKNIMVNDEFTEKSTGKFPSEPTIRKWLKPKIIETQL